VCAANTRKFQRRSAEWKAPGAVPATMSDYQKETAFLRQCLRFEDTVEHSDLEAAITRLHVNECCVNRAIWLMALFTALALAGLGYLTIMQIDDRNAEPLVTSLVERMLSALGVGSLICLVSFVAWGLANRRELNERREHGRRLIAKLVNARAERPVTAPRERQDVPDHAMDAGSARVVEAGLPATMESATRDQGSASRPSLLSGTFPA
jgi:hypothetical protein